MKSAPLAPNENLRLDALSRYEILDTFAEQEYDDLTHIAAQICGTPIALVSLVDSSRQWFKSRVGLNAEETPREIAFCSHAILEDGVFVVENALDDERFHDNPLVTGAPDIRFYAGTPLVTHDDFSLGTLCVIDTQPRELSDAQLIALQALGRQVVSQLELRLKTKNLQSANDIREKLIAMISHDLRSSFNAMIGFSRALRTRAVKMSTGDTINAASRIENASMRAHELLVSILEWSKEQLGESEKSIEVFSIYSTAHEVKALLSDIFAEKKLELAIECDIDLSLRGNKTLFFSTIMNLVSNSAKFSSEGDTVNLNVSREDKGISVVIADTGSGMDPKLAEEIFKGNEIHTSVGTGGERGTGVGTLLVKDYVHSVSGELDVKTEPGAGCTIKIFIPVNEINGQ